MNIQFKNAPINPIYKPTISSKFGANRSDRTHKGIDITVEVGTPIHAVQSGTVVAAGEYDATGCGLGIKLEHVSPDGSRYYTQYCHLSLINVLNTGAPTTRVAAGENIGYSGGAKGARGAGDSGGPHLHFELIDSSGVRIDPSSYIPTDGTYGIPQSPVGEFGSISTVTTKLPHILKSEKKPEVINEYYQNVVAPLGGEKAPIGSHISPFITSLKSLHPNIQYELTRRRFSSETINTYMPFIRLTSLLRVKSTNLSGATHAYYPSLGLNGYIDNKFEDIYNIQNNKSIVGYAIEDAAPYQQVPVIVEDTSLDPPNIPVPGIVSMNVERNAAGAMGVRGGLMRATIKIAAYSIGQIDTLLTYFLRPGTNLILEIGRQSSDPDEIITPYNWKQPWSVIRDEFDDLIKLKKPQSKFIKKYVYDNNGRYELFIGYVVKFDIKVNKNNFYDIELTVHSVQQFEIPNTLTGARSNCSIVLSDISKNKTIDIHGYFDDKQQYQSLSFAGLMRAVLEDETSVSKWSNHVVKITPNNNKDLGGTNGYFITWRFFVEVMLNDPEFGFLALYPDQPQMREYIKNSLIAPHTTVWGDHMAKRISKDNKDASHLSDDYMISNEVGYHPDLRSTNPNVMVIINKTAQNKPRQVKQIKEEYALSKSSPDKLPNMLDLDIQLGEHPGGTFDASAKNAELPGSSFLTSGVWINTNAIKKSFTTTDTVSQGILNLLVDMNACTQTYWNLQLLSNDANSPGLHVIDYGLSKNPDISTPTVLTADPLTGTNLSPSNFSDKNVFLFNKKLRPNFSVNLSPTPGINTTIGDSIGGDLLDMKLEFNLPNVVAVQVIANVGGLSEKSSLQMLNIPELHDLSVIKTSATCDDEVTKIIKTGGTVLRKNPASQPPSFNMTALVNTPWQRTPTGVPNYSSIGTATFNQADLRAALTPTIYDDPEGKRGLILAREILAPEPTPNFPGYILSGSVEYGGFGTALEWIELDVPSMMHELNLDARKGEDNETDEIPFAHAFNSSNLTKATIDLTLPGIAGISLFQIFLVDKVPTVLNQGYYRITKVAHEFSIQSGWITKLTGRFTYVAQTVKHKKPAPKEVKSTVETPSKLSPYIEGAGGKPPLTFRGSLVTTVPAESLQVTPRTKKSEFGGFGGGSGGPFP